MAKGYWIARVDVSDPDAYKAYVAAIALRVNASVCDLVIIEGYDGAQPA